MGKAGDEIASYPLLFAINSPGDLRALEADALDALAEEIRAFIVASVSRTGGHLGSNLGAVEATIALHRVFHSPEDVLLFDTGHQAYVHKLLTGRSAGFERLRKEGGLSGYPSRAESAHDWIENSHASTALSYAYGIASAFKSNGEDAFRRVVALVGDGALTGGMAYEALNNLGHSEARVVVVLNDNGRSYAPTVSKLSESLTQIRLNPSYGAIRNKVGQLISEIPGVGPIAGQSLRNFVSALREFVEPHVFFEALGIRYIGPVDGHDIAALEQALRNAATWQGPIVLHVLTRKGKGYGPAEQDEVQCLHDLKVPSNAISPPGSASDHGALFVGERPPETSYTEAFAKAVLEAARRDRRVVAVTAAMPGPTGLLPFEARYPNRFYDVGIAEQHAMTAAAGMALADLRPVVAIYSTFLSRAFDQQNLDVGLHGAPVVICADRAGITGDDGPSHHGLLDMVLALSIPEMAVFAPAEPAEIEPMLAAALELERPCLIRYPKTPGPLRLGDAASGLSSRVLREGGEEILLVGVGKMAERALEAAKLLADEGLQVTVVDPRVIRPLDGALLERALEARLVVTAEDGFVSGGAGEFVRREVERAAGEQGRLGPVVRSLGVPTRYLAHGSPETILARLGLDAQGIAASVLALREQVEAARGPEGTPLERSSAAPARGDLYP
ncbi:MAG TPA: 1-deoxy-D-xylulose-5-phosphate synthase [Acidimicrobiales bacterium]|nr:1-deoxy-D-xylulose-5-phosphate synthase [Acidimicrobiales bacterium]